MGITPTIQYASLGMADSLILMVLALVVFGPRRLPQIGRQIGKLMYEFRKASNDFKFQMEEELRNAEEADRRRAEEERLKLMALAPAETPAPEPFVETVELTPRTADETHESSPATGVASPYGDEALYPELLTSQTEIQAASAEQQPAAETETTPVIQPPTTGEQVSAAPPNSLAAQVQTAETGPATQVPADPGADTEQAFHHG